MNTDPCVVICAPQIYLIVFLVIVVYGRLISTTKQKDHLEDTFAPCDGCDYWGVTHFGLYLILGFLFPHHLTSMFIVGVGYEIFEYVAGTSSNIVSDLGPQNQTWWYGRVSDIVFNSAGLIVGRSLYQLTKVLM